MSLLPHQWPRLPACLSPAGSAHLPTSPKLLLTVSVPFSASRTPGNVFPSRYRALKAQSMMIRPAASSLGSGRPELGPDVLTLPLWGSNSKLVKGAITMPTSPGCREDRHDKNPQRSTQNKAWHTGSASPVLPPVVAVLSFIQIPLSQDREVVGMGDPGPTRFGHAFTQVGGPAPLPPTVCLAPLLTDSLAAPCPAT